MKFLECSVLTAAPGFRRLPCLKHRFHNGNHDYRDFQTRLKERLIYDPNKGVFYWKNKDSLKVAGSLHKNSHTPPNITRCIGFEGRNWEEHILAFIYMTGNTPINLIDHKDLDSLNNKWSNLREATHSQNKANTKAFRKNKFGQKGVYRVEYWTATIMCEGKTYRLGHFKTKKAAALAYNNRAKELFGEFARS